MKYVALVVGLLIVVLLLVPGVIISMFGLYGVMIAFWLGEHAGIFAPGTYNRKHDAMAHLMGWFKDVCSI